jgi:uncharacterized protein
MTGFILLIAAYAVVGAAAGILGGLLGIGGGVITVPCLYYIFYLIGYPHPYLMLLAIGTSLAAMVFNTASSTWAHHGRGFVLWDVFRKMAPGLFLGSIIGALIAKYLPETFLEMFFGIFLCILAVNFWRKRPSHDEPHRLPKMPLMLLWSLSIGGISNILGIGGGTLIVPFLTKYKVAARNAIGTSAACSLLVTSIGALSYLIIGLSKVSLPEEVGYIDLPAFITIGIVSFIMAPLGAKWTHQLSVVRIRKIFAVVLIVTGISMIL